jgi:fibronectin-binding autotransporter adhesin
MLKKSCLLVLSLFLNYKVFSATWYSTNSTSITNVANWKANMDGTGASPANFNTATDVFILQAGHTCFNFSNMVMAGTLTVNGTLNADANLTIGGTGTLNGTGTVNVTRTTATADFSTQYPIANKNLTNLTVDYTLATGNQTISAITYGNLRLSNTSGTNTAAGNIIVNGTFTTAAGGTVNLATNTLAGTLTTITNNGTISTSNTSITPLATGKTWGGTVVYAATSGSQTVVQGTYNNLTISNSSSINTAGGNLTVNGTLITTSGGTLNLGTNTLTGTLGTITNNGSIKTSNTSTTPFSSGKTWGGMGTVIYATTTGGQTVMQGTYNNLTLSNTSGINTVSGNITTTGLLTNSDNGELQLGGTTISVSGISATASQVGGGTIVLNGTFTTNAPATNIAQFSASGINIGSSNKTFNIGMSPAGSFSGNDANFGAISGTGRVIKTGAGNVFFSGANTYSGGTTILDGTIAINTDNFGAVPAVATPSNIILDGGTIDVNGTMTLNSNRGIELGASGGTISVSANAFPAQEVLTYGGIMAGSGSFTKERSGKMVLSAANTYSGGTNVARGILNIQNAAALGNPSDGFGTVVTSPGTLQLQGDITFNSQPLTLNGTGFNGTSGALNNLSGNNTWQSTITLASASTIKSEAGTITLSNANSITATNQDLTLTGAGNGLVSGTITTGTGAVTHSGLGTWTLSAVNTYTGGTNISGGGTLKIGINNAISNTSAVTISSGTLDLANHSDAIGSLAGSGTVTSTVVGSPVLTTGNNNSSTTFSGIIQNGTGTAVGLTKVGTGTMTITGANTYTGTTTVTKGTLAFGATNTIGKGAMVLNGGTLSTGGFANTTTGTLQLTDSSSLVLGGGAPNALTFAASDATAWTSGKILVITNWNGSITAAGSSGTRGQLFVGTSSSGLTLSQLAQIRFLISSTYYDAVQLSTGEVVPTIIPLPIILLNFNASKNKEGSLLSWATSFEIDSKYFIIERSCDGYNWDVVGTVPTQQGLGKKNYQMLDIQPCQGINYYKLVEVSTYGEHKDYGVVLLEYEQENVAFELYPNPNNGHFSIKLYGDYLQYELTIIDVLGKEICKLLLLNGVNLFEYNHLASGVYFAKLKINREWVVRRFLIE